VLDIELHVEEVTGADKTLDIVVDIFNRVDSGGTKLSKGDLAARQDLCGMAGGSRRDETEPRGMGGSWLLFQSRLAVRSVNTVLTGEARFSYLHDKRSLDIQEGLRRATKQINASLNLIAGRLGLDYDRVLFGRFGIPVMCATSTTTAAPIGEGTGQAALQVRSLRPACGAVSRARRRA
jgi:hypothetical protein